MMREREESILRTRDMCVYEDYEPREKLYSSNKFQAYSRLLKTFQGSRHSADPGDPGAQPFQPFKAFKAFKALKAFQAFQAFQPFQTWTKLS